MPKASIGKAGNAPLVRQGHTTDGKFGSDPAKQQKGGSTVRDLRAK